MCPKWKVAWVCHEILVWVQYKSLIQSGVLDAVHRCNASTQLFSNETHLPRRHPLMIFAWPCCQKATQSDIKWFTNTKCVPPIQTLTLISHICVQKLASDANKFHIWFRFRLNRYTFSFCHICHKFHIFLQKLFSAACCPVFLDNSVICLSDLS